MSNKKFIYCLFSIANDYDQPDNNLLGFWFEKPSIDEISKVLAIQFPNRNDEITLKMVNIWKGDIINIDNCEYRVQKIYDNQRI